MRIALVSTPFISVPPVGYGGTELFCWELSNELTLRGHDVTLFTTGDSEPPCRRRSLYRTAQWPPTSADELNHCAWALSEVNKGSYDVVHLNSALAVPLTRFSRVPAVCTLHHHAMESLSRIYAVHPDVHYVAISARQLELEVPLARARVIHHGLSPRRYPPGLRDEGYLLHIGRFSAEKGTHLAIDAARAAGLHLVLAGRTHQQDEQYYRTDIEPRLRGPGITLAGEADHDRKLALLRGARALICPLRWEEPFGLVAIEAMLCGVPVVGFARGAFPEIVEEGHTGFLAPDGDLDALVGLVRRLDGFDRAACARRARERFVAEMMTGAYESLYREVVGAERSRDAAKRAA